MTWLDVTIATGIRNHHRNFMQIWMHHISSEPTNDTLKPALLHWFAKPNFKSIQLRTTVVLKTNQNESKHLKFDDTFNNVKRYSKITTWTVEHSNCVICFEHINHFKMDFSLKCQFFFSALTDICVVSSTLLAMQCTHYTVIF